MKSLALILSGRFGGRFYTNERRHTIADIWREFRQDSFSAIRPIPINPAQNKTPSMLGARSRDISRPQIGVNGFNFCQKLRVNLTVEERTAHPV